jgi:uncharacterized membrane protein required for colicin V production
LTIFPTLGLQFSVTRRSYFVGFLPLWSSGSTNFIHQELIVDVVIDEGIQGAGIKPYLAILVRAGEETSRSIVAFPVRLTLTPASTSFESL